MTRSITIDAAHALQFHTFGDDGAGPHALITAGIHGGEATGIYAAHKLMAWLETQKLNGRVTVLPVANPGAFRRSTRANPYDELDMNRIFPGKAEGSPTQRAAAAIWEEAKQADFIVDLHCCGLFGSDYTLALWQESPAARELAEQLDIPVVIESGGTRNQLFVEATHAGIPAVIIELAGGQMGPSGGIINMRSGEHAFRAVANLLVRRGLVAGDATPASPTFFGKLREVSCRQDGLWSPRVHPGARVEAGQVIGMLEGDEVTSPVTGVATMVRAASYLFIGDTVAMVAPQA
jgi:uncharacterized protein